MSHLEKIVFKISLELNNDGGLKRKAFDEESIKEFLLKKIVSMEPIDR